MAQDALAVTCLKDVWTLVAENVVSGSIFRGKIRPVYIQDVKLNGEAAPVNNDNAAPIFSKKDYEPIGSDAPVDVYIKAIRYDGAVTVHL